MTLDRRRIVAAVAAAVTVVVGLGVHRFAPDGAVSDIAGDALYALLVYLLAVVIVPRRALWVPALGAWVWCAAIELFQLTGLPLSWGDGFPPIMLVLGTVFDVRDLVVYTVTVLAAATVDRLSGAARGRARAERGA
ncbi:DUF2809 domain-containing protein [Microbacterium sp. BG28]|uniref:DUF2809 domain-containing protein n=1 Tax=Microbacterium sp. BG28 TaxID=3097356 RepID=UPI002A5AA1CB|nr:DUF2809 domain-containing protein [Microbacterium sp. BG28]MDY0829592.1 DUF2809 domain-containing protein [Microbacterium sp. BG28]